MPNDPRKIAFEQSRVDKFSNTLFIGTPDSLTPLTTAEFRSAVQKKAVKAHLLGIMTNFNFSIDSSILAAVIHSRATGGFGSTV